MSVNTYLNNNLVNVAKATQVQLSPSDQVSFMPTAAAANEGYIYQYIGTSTEDYINGYFYKCISDGAATPAYSWQPISTQPTQAAAATPYTDTDGYLNADNVQDALYNLAALIEPQDFRPLSVTENGVYIPPTPYGYDKVNVNVSFYPREDAPLEDISLVESNDMHIEPTDGTSYYPRLFLMSTPNPNTEQESPTNRGKYFAPTDGDYTVIPYIDIIDKSTEQSITGYPKQVNSSASYNIDSGGYARLKNWTYGNDKISVTTTLWNTLDQSPTDDTATTQNDVDDWCSEYATGPYIIYDDLDYGVCGTNATWVLHKNGQLVISGTGVLWAKSQITWDNTKVVDVIVNEGITRLSPVYTSELFKNCTNIRNVYLPSTLTRLDNSCFEGSSIENVYIPTGMKQIGAYVFRYCSNLTTLTLPNTVNYINNFAFSRCTSLTSLTVLATTPPSFNTYGPGIPAGTTIYVPAASVDTYKTKWSQYANQIQAINE